MPLLPPEDRQLPEGQEGEPWSPYLLLGAELSLLALFSSQSSRWPSGSSAVSGGHSLARLSSVEDKVTRKGEGQPSWPESHSSAEQQVLGKPWDDVCSVRRKWASRSGSEPQV